MLSKIKSLDGYRLDTLDGEIGHVKDVYFDDHHWTVRYLVADTGNWLSGRQVLLAPHALLSINGDDRLIKVNLTKKQIENSPGLSADKPVSQQFEYEYYGYYGWPIYWGGSYIWGSYPYVPSGPFDSENRGPEHRPYDHHLRSAHAVCGHSVHAVDGDIGHVADFVVDDKTWAIRYLVVDTQNWWPGKHVLISTDWVSSVSWSEMRVFLNLSRESIRVSPEYSKEALIRREYEINIHKHYRREGYWVDEEAAKEFVGKSQ
jgi:uncharacterized protein YrrD